jgi:class 3 adenylate cyclase/tetratricopeptide (TPR) repeat protein
VSNTGSIIEQAILQERHGSLLAAYDLLQTALRHDPGDQILRHRAILLLARGGATDEASRHYASHGLDQVIDHEDVIALGGRLLKDRALASVGAARLAHAHAAIGKYRQAFELRKSLYPAINIAMLQVLIGDFAAAREGARWVLSRPGNGEENYFDWATRCEAQVILGQADQADVALGRAIACDPADLASRASTLRQLEILGLALGQDMSWLQRHRPAESLHYCGHMFAWSQGSTCLDALAATLRAEIERRKPGAMFGALAAGGDLLLAEAALAAGADLHVVLPFEEAEFLRCSVAPYGAEWLPRYHECRRRAASFRIYLPEPYLGDDHAFSLGSSYAMGLAIRHAQANRGPVAQLCLWDGVVSDQIAGTSMDRQIWRSTGLPQTIIDFPGALRQPALSVPPREPLIADRRPRAILFGDVSGFSRLSERQVQLFFGSVMASLAEILQQDDFSPELAEGWGDGLHLVFEKVGKAARTALALQAGFRAMKLEEHGLPGDLALRIGGHYGPLTPMTAGITGANGYVGVHNTIAARIEPVTLPGAIFVSEPFAAMLALEDAQGKAERCQSGYVGMTDLPKSFGAMRLFSLQPPG